MERADLKNIAKRSTLKLKIMRKISEEQLLYLLRRDMKLTLLENSGVDNWDWYGDALSNEDDDKDKQEQLDFMFGDADPEINDKYMKKYEKLD